MSPYCIACEMILAMLSNLLWASSLIELCFPCFAVRVLGIFHVMDVPRVEARLVTLKTIPTGNPTPLANAEVEIFPVITADVIRILFAMPAIVLNFFFFFCILPTNFNFIKEK